MNKPETATKYPASNVRRGAFFIILALAAAMPSMTFCRASDDVKTNTLQKAAQEWIQVGKEQYNRELYKAAKKSFLRAAIYRNYLTDAERKKLDEMLEQSANAALAKELTSVGARAADDSAPSIQPIEAAKVVALDTKAVEVKPRARIIEPEADSVKDGELLTKKEWEYITEKPLSTSVSGLAAETADKAAKTNIRTQEEEKIRPYALSSSYLPASLSSQTSDFLAVDPKAASGPRIIFEPGDVIEVRFFYTPELDITQTVRPDGRISLQLIPEVIAQGKTAAELREELIRLYDPHLRAPEISVVARSFYNQRVFVGGEVLRPGVVQMPGRMTALEAIMEVGGFDIRAAERKSVIVIRYAGGRRLAYKLDLKQAVAGKESEPFYLQPKDIIHVPRTSIARLNQWIDQHINKLIPDTGFFLRRTSGDTTYGMGNFR